MVDEMHFGKADPKSNGNPLPETGRQTENPWMRGGVRRVPRVELCVGRGQAGPSNDFSGWVF